MIVEAWSCVCLRACSTDETKRAYGNEFFLKLQNENIRHSLNTASYCCTYEIASNIFVGIHKIINGRKPDVHSRLKVHLFFVLI